MKKVFLVPALVLTAFAAVPLLAGPSSVAASVSSTVKPMKKSSRHHRHIHYTKTVKLSKTVKPEETAKTVANAPETAPMAAPISTPVPKSHWW